MRRFIALRAVAAPLDRQDVDTDQIIPARFLRKPRSELGDYVFYDLRFDGRGDPDPRWPLGDERVREAQILVAGKNFGCGSSREAAVWALANPGGGFVRGLRCVIAPSFGDIFANNAANNGVLTVRLAAETCRALGTMLRERPGAELEVRLPEQQVIAPDGAVFDFDIDPFHKECLIEGLELYDLTMRHRQELLAYEHRAARERPWVVASVSPGERTTHDTPDRKARAR